MSDLPEEIVQAPNPVIQPSAPHKTGETVTVACKLPSGLILRIFEEQVVWEPQRDGGSKKITQFLPIPDMQFVIKGTWLASGGQAFHRQGIARELLPGGYALTSGCPKEIWDRWYEANKNGHLVRNGLIFAHKITSTAREKATELSATKTGMEPVDPTKPSDRIPGGLHKRLKMGVLQQES